MKNLCTIVLILFGTGFINAEEKCESRIPFGINSETGHYLSVENSRVYYELYGDVNNQPLVLIHGNGGSIAAMKCQIVEFMKDYFVIVADNRTHGKSGKSNQLTYIQITNDYVKILDHLALDSAFVLGQSDGGIIGLLMAINHSSKVKKLVASVPNIRPGKGVIADWELEFSKNYRALIDAMISIGDSSRDWQNEKVHMNLMATEPNIPVSDLHKISCPVMVMTSDDDIIKPRHILEIYENIPNAHLFVMPGATHFMIRDEYELFNYMANRFFKKPFKRPKSKEVLMELIGIEQ